MLQAGLFSAINTAFIVVTVTNLAANPADQTNALLILLVTGATSSSLKATDLNPTFHATAAAVRQNCVLFGSLCSSLLAAAGAVLAKQWLGTYERTGQIGSHESQSLRRTQKFYGAEAWGLRPVVEALPSLLLLSLALFFVALVDYLWVLSTPVAIVVTAFIVVGTAMYGFTLVAGAIDPRCPFQTSTSSSARKFTLLILRLLARTTPGRWLRARIRRRRAMSRLSPDQSIVKNLAVSAFQMFKTYASHEDDMNSSEDELGDVPPLQKEMLCAQSVVWMLETASEDNDFRLTADNIPSIHRREAVQVIARSPYFFRLVAQFKATVLAGKRRRDTSSYRPDALTILRAVAHVFAADPERCYFVTLRTLHGLTFDEKTSPDTAALYIGLLDFCHHLAGNTEQHVAGLHSGSKRDNASTVLVQRTTLLPLYMLCAMAGSSQAMERYVTKESRDSDVLISLTAVAIANDIRAQQGEPVDWPEVIRDVWSARSG